MATTTERIAVIVDANTGGAVRDIEALQKSTANVGNTQLQTASKTGFLQSKLDAMGLSGVSSGALMSAGMAAGGAAIAGLIAVTQRGIQKQLELADSVRKVSQVSGLSAEASSRLVEITGDYNVNADTLAKTMFKLSQQVDINRDALTRHGIKIAENKDGSVDLEGTLVNVQKAYKNAGDATERNAIVMDAFGKAGKDLIPVLEETKDLKQALADVPGSRILSQEDLDQARAYQLAMDDLGDALDAFQRMLGSAVIPQLTRYVTVVNQVLEAVLQVKNAAGPVADGIGMVGDAAIRSVPGVGQLYGVTKDITEIFGIGKGKSDEYADAQKRVADAEKNLKDLVLEGKTGTREYRDAQNELANAKDALEGKTRKIVEALQTENEKTQESINLTYTRMNQLAGLLGSALNYEEAQNKQTAAQANLDRLRAEGKEGTLEYIAAERELQRAAIGTVQSYTAMQTQVQQLGADLKSGKISQAEYNAKIEEMRASSPAAAWALGIITGGIEAHANTIGRVPGWKHTVVTADTSDADWKLGSITSKLATIAKNAFVHVSASVGGVEGFGAEGAVVNRPTVALIGEAGPEILMPLHKLPGNGPVPNMSGAGGIGSVVININGFNGDERALAIRMREEIIRIGQRTGSAFGDFA